MISVLLMKETIEMAKVYDAGVKDYRDTYWMPDYTR
ncbi:Ribulose bisphosphate carboxylase large chain (EC [uncultured Gammaproteobacteria bacterium]|nr:Ribulose bisphosphate carboxylase large chain (EC [uncultured Gammaproteobacteria bacterium]